MDGARSRFLRNLLIMAGSVIGATLLRSVIDRYLDERINYATFYLAIILTSLYCGFAWGAACTAVSGVFAAIVLPPFGRFLVDEPSDLVGMILFLTVSGFIVWLSYRFRQSQQRAEDAAEERQELLVRERAARAEAERLNRAKDDFLAAVSHELRTPLQSILGWSELLREGEMDAEDIKLATASIERSVKMQSQLINDLLDLSRIVMGKLRLEPRPTSLGDVVREAVQTVLPAAVAKQVRIDVECSGVCVVLGDANRLQQIVWNLLTNAIKFTPSGGIIRAHIEPTEDSVRLTVRDNGDGIAAEALAKIFERFEQGEIGRRRDGLGLGLAIVKELVQLHGGTIAASSDGKGRGAEFRAEFPKHQPSAISIEDSGEFRRLENEGGSLAGRQVLVVDDDADARRVLKEVLTQCGADVLTAESAQQARELLASYDPDAITCDLDMPGASGYDFIRELRASEEIAKSQTPVLALTASASDADRKKTLALGFQQHLAKPVRPQELASAIADVSKRPKPR